LSAELQAFAGAVGIGLAFEVSQGISEEEHGMNDFSAAQQ